MRCGIGLRVIGIALVLTLAGCERPQQHAASPPSGAASTDAASAAGGSSAWFVEGRGQGLQREEACESAIESLSATLLGDPTWRRLVPVELSGVVAHADVSEDPSGQGVACRVGLDSSDAAALLVEFEHAAPVVVGPAPWRDPLFGYVLARRSNHGCARRAELFGVVCEPTDVAEAERALATLSSGVSLAPIYLGGVPVDGDGRLLRRPGVMVMLHGVGVAEVPVVGRRDSEGDVYRTTTDPEGRARFGERRDVWSTPLVVSIDADVLLGPVAHVWPPESVTLRGRPVDARRWRAVSTAKDAEPFIERLSESLVRRGLPQPAEVEPQAERSLRNVAPTDLPVLADVLAGRLDVVFVVSVRTRFAGRASGARVWHEATVSADVYETWTGRRLTRLEVRAKATGAGDRAAADAASRGAVEPLVTAILSDEAIPVPDDARPSNRAVVSVVRPEGP